MAGSPRPRAAAEDGARIEAKVRAGLAPSPEFLSRLATVRAELVRSVTSAARDRGIPLARALIAGSAARGTFLTDRLDIDLFLLFPPALSREEMARAGLALGEAVLTSPERKYADHPYLRGWFQGFRVDAVPGYALTDPAQPISPVDRTPFHDEYLRARQGPEQVAEVRLLKQFLRTLGVYGAEVRTQGFSGYLVELLILEAGGFRALLEAARHWRIPVRLRPPAEDPPRLPEEVALILADPVDPHRNVGSALSRRNLAVFILAADAYLAAPHESWFRPRQLRPLFRADALARLERRGTEIVVVELARPDLVDDTLVPQVRRAERAIAEEAERQGYRLVGHASSVGPSRLLIGLEVESIVLPRIRRQEGPPAGIEHARRFLEKWTAPESGAVQGPYVTEEGRLAVEAPRPFPDLREGLAAALPRLSLGKNLAAPGGPGTVRPLAEVDESEELGELLRELLDKRLPWVPERPHRDGEPVRPGAARRR
ncbi:MAG: CCA tRNA nucleotidyltransferase [Thermoplasmata archaeon]